MVHEHLRASPSWLDRLMSKVVGEAAPAGTPATPPDTLNTLRTWLGNRYADVAGRALPEHGLKMPRWTPGRALGLAGAVGAGNALGRSVVPGWQNLQDDN